MWNQKVFRQGGPARNEKTNLNYSELKSPQREGPSGRWSTTGVPRWTWGCLGSPHKCV